MQLLLLLGGNIGDVKSSFNSALVLLADAFGAPVKASKLYQSEAWGFHSEHSFLNQVVEFDVNLPPLDILELTQEIEVAMGRQNKTATQYESRPIDIDILFYGDTVMDTPTLTIPHKLLHERRFTLCPLAECWPNLIHPLLHCSIAQLLKQCPDEGQVKCLDN